jgi:hypothetical protein
MAEIEGAEDWLYGKGFDVTKQEYVVKIDSLRSVGNLIEARLAATSNGSVQSVCIEL